MYLSRRKIRRLGAALAEARRPIEVNVETGDLPFSAAGAVMVQTDGLLYGADAEIGGLREQLETLKERIALKDDEIAELREQLAVRTEKPPVIIEQASVPASSAVSAFEADMKRRVHDAFALPPAMLERVCLTTEELAAGRRAWIKTVETDYSALAQGMSDKDVRRLLSAPAARTTGPFAIAYGERIRTLAGEWGDDNGRIAELINKELPAKDRVGVATIKRARRELGI